MQPLKMRIPCSLYMVCAFTISTYGQSDVRRPPSMKPPYQATNVYFKEDYAINLTCSADGTPPIEYAWKRNGEDLNLNGSGRSNGNITIGGATKKDDGFYQCFATNDYGTALSTVAHVQQAFLTIADSQPVIRTVQEGHPFLIPAARSKCLPTPTFDWAHAEGKVDSSRKPYQQTPRVHSASNGDLYFAFAERDDELGGRIYKSVVSNAQIDLQAGGGYTTVAVTPGPSPDFPPNITYFSKSHEVGLIGSWIAIECFFSGKPAPKIAWSRPRGNLPSGRNSISRFETLLNISNIIASDEGVYVCTATNSKGTANYVHNISRIEAVPIFRGKSDRPRDVNVTEGDSVTFNCSAFAIPGAFVNWFLNGKPIDVKNAPQRFIFNKDNKSLTIRDVCRDCVDRERPTDLMVIQCNASNVHGYAFAQGYLNVLLRTKVTLQPSSTFESIDLTIENRFQFNCSATSDPSTLLAVRWYKVREEGKELVRSAPPYLFEVNGTFTLHTEPNCSDSCYEYLGEYKCVADNGYTEDSVIVILNSTTERISPAPLPASLNWIAIGIAIVLFLLLLILICCIVCLLTKGDEYDVDGKERKSGKNPEEEIQATGFQDYYPSEYVKSKGSVASLGSVENFRGMDAISEYDDDVRNFVEDGSLVGKYSERTLYK